MLDPAADPEAFGVFYDRHVTDLVAYFYRRVACPHTAADLAAETFATALVNRARFDPARGPARAWLFGIGTKQLGSWYRRGRVADRHRRRSGMGPVSLSEPDLERIETLVDLGPLRARLHNALDQLSPALREALWLRVVDDLPFAEVAERLGINPGTARVRVSRALAQLNHLIEDS